MGSIREYGFNSWGLQLAATRFAQAEKEGSNQETKALQETKLGNIKNRNWDHNQPVAIHPG